MELYCHYSYMTNRKCFSESPTVCLLITMDVCRNEWDSIYRVTEILFIMFFLWLVKWKWLFSDFLFVPVLSISVLLTETWEIQYLLYLLPESVLSLFTTTVEMSDWNLLSPLSGKAYLRHGPGFCEMYQTWKLFQSIITHPVNAAFLCLVFQQVFFQNDSTPSHQSRLCYVCLGLLFVRPFLVLSGLRWRKYQT